MKTQTKANDNSVEDNPANEPLKRFFFHTVKNGKLEWQGRITRQWDQYVLVALYSWLDGNVTCCHVIRTEELVWNSESKTGFLLYPDQELFEFSYKHGVAFQAQQRGLIEAEKEIDAIKKGAKAA